MIYILLLSNPEGEYICGGPNTEQEVVKLMKWTAQRYTPTFSLLDTQNYPPSVGNLLPTLTINGITVYPTFRYNGRDANATNWPAWGYGETLTLTGTGTAPTYNNGSPLLGSVDDSIRFNGLGGEAASGKGYVSGEAANGNVGTNDYVFECVLCGSTALTNSAAGYVWCKGAAAAPYNIVQLYRSGANAYFIGYLGDGAATVTIQSGSGVFPVDAYIHAMLFVDRSGSAQWYINGVATGAAVGVSSVSAAVNSAVAGLVGAYATTGTYGFGGNILHLALWQGASWLDTHLQATVAKTRLAQLTGVYPQTAKGTALPTVMTRTTPAYLDKVEADGTTKLYYVGPNWPRVCSRKDTAGNVVRGYLSETEATNSLTLSTALGSWATSQASITTTAVVLPDGTTGTANVLKDTIVDGFHYIVRASGGANTSARTITLYAKAIGGTWGHILTDGGKSCYFNCVTGAIGAAAGIVGTSSARGNGWWKFSFYVAAWVASSDFYISPASADNTQNYAGDATDRMALWFPQIELGNASSSPIPTAAAAVTRTADSLRYKMDDGNLTAGKGSLVVDFMGANVDQPVSTRLMEICDGTAVNQIALYLVNAGKKISTVLYNGSFQASIESTTDIWDGNKHTIRATWKTNQARQYVDGAVDGTEDTSCTIPSSLSQLDVGAYLSAGYEANGLLSNLRIYGGVTTKG